MLGKKTYKTWRVVILCFMDRFDAQEKWSSNKDTVSIHVLFDSFLWMNSLLVSVPAVPIQTDKLNFYCIYLPYKRTCIWCMKHVKPINNLFKLLSSLLSSCFLSATVRQISVTWNIFLIWIDKAIHILFMWKSQEDENQSISTACITHSWILFCHGRHNA